MKVFCPWMDAIVTVEGELHVRDFSFGYFSDITQYFFLFFGIYAMPKFSLSLQLTFSLSQRSLLIEILIVIEVNQLFFMVSTSSVLLKTVFLTHSHIQTGSSMFSSVSRFIIYLDRFDSTIPVLHNVRVKFHYFFHMHIELSQANLLKILAVWCSFCLSCLSLFILLNLVDNFDHFEKFFIIQILSLQILSSSILYSFFSFLSL